MRQTEAMLGVRRAYTGRDSQPQKVSLGEPQDKIQSRSKYPICLRIRRDLPKLNKNVLDNPLFEKIFSNFPS